MASRSKAARKRELEELRQRVADLEARLKFLEARPIIAPYVTGPYYEPNTSPFAPKVWCGPPARYPADTVMSTG